MKTILFTAIVAALLSAPAAAQKLTLDLDKLGEKAREKTEINLAGPALEALPKSLVEGRDIQEVYIRAYEFDNPGQYSLDALEPLRKQVAGNSGWSRILSSKEPGEFTEIYLYSQGGKTAGFLLIAAERKELTVIYVRGNVQMAQVQELVQSTIQYDLTKAAGNQTKQ
jgi:hypothetical protein